MKAAAILIILLLTLVLALIVAAGWASDRAAEHERARGAAEAQIIHAQGQAALDRAQAISAQMTALAGVIGATGVVLVGIIGVVGVLLVAGLLIHSTAVVASAAITGITAIARRQPSVIERQVIYLPRPGQTRSDLWRQLSSGQAELLPSPQHNRNKGKP